MSLPASATSTPEPQARNSAADQVAKAVLACPGVVALNGGGLAPVATYLPGRRVAGVRVDEHRILVSVTVARGCRVPELAERIRANLWSFAAGRPVDLHVADITEQPGVPPLG